MLAYICSRTHEVLVSKRDGFENLGTLEGKKNCERIREVVGKAAFDVMVSNQDCLIDTSTLEEVETRGIFKWK